MNLTRRHFSLALTATALAGFKTRASAAAMKTVLGDARAFGYGPLESDPNGLLDLPRGFSYKVISALGDAMSDGNTVPDHADGMGCFDLGDGRLALVRNHELKPWQLEDVNAAEGAGAFDRNADGKALPGGTTTIVYNPATQAVEKQYRSLLGTIRNCAGGTTPWGSWLTCEEDVSTTGEGFGQDHGWVFEVPAAAPGLVDARPLKALGRFNHEAAAVDPRTGIVYLTEDRDDSLFYRFIPTTPGKLAEGGRLQALGFADVPAGADTRNWDDVIWKVGDWKDATWIDLENPESPDDDLRYQGHDAGAAIFARGEGIHWGDGEVYFCCTSGGVKGLGQIMRYRPSADEGTSGEARDPGAVQLFLESEDPGTFNFGDNLTVAPNGHLMVCEDQYTEVVENKVRGVTPGGQTYDLALIRVQTEPAGACFSPDGKTFFVNLYSPAKTLAITGPWDSVRDNA